MIMLNSVEVSTGDITEYAWFNLRRYHNVSYVEDQIVAAQNIPATQRANVRKQAKQIRHCLMQAREYFQAASLVSLVTKPTLLYYSAMSLALAQLLFKGDGNSSLDRAREHHRHHGLVLRTSNLNSHSSPLAIAAECLSAEPMNRAGDFLGTFELWHQTCREVPLPGLRHVHHEDKTSTTQFCTLYSAVDARLRRIPIGGLTLSKCFQSIPQMSDFLSRHKVASRTFRAKLEIVHNADPSKIEVTLTIHPGESEVIEAFHESLLFDPNLISHVNYRVAGTGGIASWTGHPVMTNFPHVSAVTTKELRFWPTEEPLNEFGYIYVALFIIGNYARYFPDLWIRDVEECTSLSLAIEELIAIAERRIPLLTLSELSRTYYVPVA